MSRVLVTGGGGFIGRHVVEQLVDRGDEVTVMLAPAESPAGVRRFGADVVRADVRDLPSLDEVVQGQDAVIHMAALYSLWMRDWQRLYDVNVQGTLNVIAACRRAGTKRLVYTSSIAALGVNSGMAPFKEFFLVYSDYMFLQVSISLESRGTNFTFEGFFFSRNPIMNCVKVLLQVVFQRKTVIADVTYMRLCLFMYSFDMTIALRLHCKFLITNGAAKRVFSLMNG